MKVTMKAIRDLLPKEEFLDATGNDGYPLRSKWYSLSRWGQGTETISLMTCWNDPCIAILEEHFNIEYCGVIWMNAHRYLITSKVDKV